MDFRDMIAESWQKMMRHIGPILLITFAQLVLIIITFGILAPVTTAGYVHSLMRVVHHDRPPAVGDLFSQMRLFLPLLVFSLVALLVVFMGFLLLVLPGFAAILGICFAAFYLIPLMVEQRLGLVDALKASWNLAIQPPVSDQFVVVIIYVAIMSLGSSLPFAFLLTQPMATFIMVIAYRERAGAGGENPLRSEPPAPAGPENQESGSEETPADSPSDTNPEEKPSA